MTPQIRKTYLALSKSGHTVSSFDTPELARRFIERQAGQGVTLQLVEETTVRRACPIWAGATQIVTLSDRRAGGGRG